MASSTPRSTPSAERGRGGEETQQTRCWKAWNMQAFSHTLCRCTIWWDVTAQLLSSRGTQISSVIKLVSLANANGGLEKKSGCVSMVNQDSMQNKNAICVSCWCPATYIWIHIKKHSQIASLVLQASQNLYACLNWDQLMFVVSCGSRFGDDEGQAVISPEAHHHCFVSW